MAKARPDQPLVPSVLDRLIDHQPHVSTESPKSRGVLLRELIAAVRRDLENLLNTRRWCKEWPEHLTELDRSLVGYGLPDVTGANIGSPSGREQYLRIIERAITLFEPRLLNVRVSLLQNAEELDRTLRFRIDALLRCDPAPEPVVFDSQLETATGSFAVRGDSG